MDIMRSPFTTSVTWTILVFLLYIITYTTSTRTRVTPTTMTRNIEEENVKFLLDGPPVLVESIQNTLAHLPCNVTAPLMHDRVALVIWYKVGSKTPIYSVDTRESNFTHGTHWSDELYRERLTFNLEGRSGILTIKSTQQEDTGEYRCRVDFQKSPTRNSKVNLTVINPPESIIILDSKGSTIKDHVLGPYNEGEMVNITCVAVGGQPQPRVTWWHGNLLLDSTSHLLSDRRVGNILSLGKLKRKNLHMQLTCQASNNNLTIPITSTITMDMNLRPLLVKLQGENHPLSADHSYQLSCVVIGSRPSPTITWWKGSTPMKNTHEITNPDGNMTTSILTFTPTIDDRGKYLSCRAEQTMIPESGMEDGWKLDIYHIPVVTLELGTNSMNSTLREGIDVFFECNIKSNPWVSKVSWRHNGNILENNIAEGIIVANQSLVLQNVSRARSGIYTCVGSNREGDGESNPVHLDIRFAPVCRHGQRVVYSTGRHETAKIACEIEANPTEATYVWKFNATLGETIDIPASLIAIDRGRSIAHYTPMTENDYGTLLCWASNEIGDQSEPCLYTIMPAGEPDPLINCTLLNQTSTGFQIECIEGFDGGLQQDFIMEVYVNGTTRHPRIYKSKTPYFEVRGLIPGAGYNVFLIAHNSKGRSNATILQVYTLKDPEKQTVTITYKKLFNKTIENDNEKVTVQPPPSYITSTATTYKKNLSLAYAPVIEDIRPFLGILVGIVGSIFLVAVIIVIIVRVRGSSGHDRNNYTTTTTTTTTTTNQHGRGLHGLHNGNDLHTGRGNCHVTSSLDSIDKNPDIIPQDGHDEDDEWTTKAAHNHAYATAALAEQNAAITSSSYDHIIPTYSMVEKKSILQQQHQQQQQQQQHLQQLQAPSSASHHGQYIQYSTLIPVNKMTVYGSQQHHHHHQQRHQHQQQQQQHQQQQQQQQQHQQQQQQLQNIKTDITHENLTQSLAGNQPQRLVSYCSATLGRPRQNDLKRAEPNIYSQIDLAHNTMYSTSPIFPASITGVTMSHPSQLATFSPSPPAIFANKVVNSTQQQQQHQQQQQQQHQQQQQQHQQIFTNSKVGESDVGGLVCKVPNVMATATHHKVPSIICTTQRRPPQSPPTVTCNLSSTSTPNNSALSLASSRADNLLNLQKVKDTSIVVTSMASGCDSNTPNESMTTPGGLLKTVPEEIVHHQLNGDNILITQDRNHVARF